MPTTLIASLQLFGIGFSFALAGPCLLTCAPVLLYIVGTNKRWLRILADTLVFLLGRILAYLILGYLAGSSANLLNRFISSSYSVILQPLGGLVSILLGVFVLFSKEQDNFFCKIVQSKMTNYGNIFVLGFIVGITPCAPLVALLFEIALISKTALAATLYTLSFGLGACLASLILIAGFAKILTGLAVKVFKSNVSGAIFKITCAALLIFLGINIITSSLSLR